MSSDLVNIFYFFSVDRFKTVVSVKINAVPRVMIIKSMFLSVLVFVCVLLICKYTKVCNTMQVNCNFFNIYLFVFLIYLYTEYSDFIGIFTAFNMGQNGGARPGAGRKPKIQEIKLIEQMDAISVPEEIWKALLYKCQEGDTAAIKLWLSYRFGLPKQQIDVTTNGENIAPPIQWISKNIAIESAKVIEDSDPLDSDSLDLNRLDYQADQDNQDNQDNKLFI